MTLKNIQPRKHHRFNIHYINYPKTNRKIKGVYMIDNLYIGASTHNRGRIISHCNLSIRGKHYNKLLQSHIAAKTIKGEVINICLLDEDIFKEEYYIKILKPKLNISPITYSNRIKT